METDLQEELRAIYAKFLAEMKDIMEDGDDSDIAWLTPKAEDKFIASLTSLITRKQTSELMSVHRYMRQWDSDNVHGQTSDFILNRVKELKTLAPGGSDNETN